MSASSDSSSSSSSENSSSENSPPDLPGPDVASVSRDARGPVERLEEHVPDDWWRTLFGETYLLTDADVLGDENTRAEADAAVAALGLAPEQRVLDLCCGQGRHALELVRRDFRHVCGLDQSAHLIGEAKAAAAREELAVDFREGDARELPYADDAFDAVLLMGNSFGYFAAAADDRAMLGEVRRVLRDGGRVLLDLTDAAHLRARYEPRSWEWIDEDHFACRERTLDGDRLVTREVVTHVGRGVIADQFYAERLYDRADLHRLLRAGGFSNVAIGPAPETASTRGQDLGMMAHRLFVSARAGRALTENGDAASARWNGREVPEEASGEDRLRVPVLLGDPRLPDETKLGGVFDEDDFEVVGRLKDALATLDGYAFSYHDDHGTLEEELRALRGKADFVFNLCDEGFGNDPRQELHVPALLERLGLPYTGAGPQCLACCYDKSLVRGAAREIGVAVAEGRYLEPGAPVPETLDLDFPVIVKPNTGDNSKGITQDSVAKRPEDLPRAVAAVRAQVGPERALLIEAFLPGKDLTVGLVGSAGDEGGLTVLPIVEESYAHLPAGLPRLCGYEAKWLPDSPYWMGNAEAPQAELPAETHATLQRDSRRLFARLGCRDYARLDWRLDAEGRPRLLEVNPNPGWCWDGHLAAQAALDGTDYAGLLGRLLRSAACRKRGQSSQRFRVRLQTRRRCETSVDTPGSQHGGERPLPFQVEHAERSQKSPDA